jgi:hypothetical protein
MTLLAVICCLLLSSATAFAQQAQEPEEQHGTAGEPEHQEHRHHVGVFAGITHDHGEDESTAGADYEYRVPGVRFLGVGALVDHAGGEIDSTVVAAAAFIHLRKRLRLLVAPGIEHSHGENESLVRAGVAYQLRLKRLSFSPEFNVDFVDGERIEVYGVSVGWGF